MRLRKILILLLILLLLLPLTACRRDTGANDPEDPDPGEDVTDPDEDPPDPADDPDPDDDPDPGPPEITSLAGITLGDSAAEVTRLFGRMYEEQKLSEDEGYYGEGVSFWNYQDRIFFTIGQSSQKVLRIDVSVADYQTNLGVRVGQRADSFLPQYRDYYEELVSIHTDETNPGWFMVENGGLLIFFFNDGDETLFGLPIPDQAIVEGITLAYLEHFD